MDQQTYIEKEYASKIRAIHKTANPWTRIRKINALERHTNQLSKIFDWDTSLFAEIAALRNDAVALAEME